MHRLPLLLAVLLTAGLAAGQVNLGADPTTQVSKFWIRGDTAVYNNDQQTKVSCPGEWQPYASREWLGEEIWISLKSITQIYQGSLIDLCYRYCKNGKKQGSSLLCFGLWASRFLIQWHLLILFYKLFINILSFLDFFWYKYCITPRFIAQNIISHEQK